MPSWLKRISVLLLAVFLLTYVCYQVFQVLYSNVELETIGEYSVYDTLETQVMVIRQETVMKVKTGDGHLYYTLNNGERIGKGGMVAQIFESEEAAGVQQELSVMDADIARMKSVEALAANNYSDLEAVTQQITSTAQNISILSSSGNAEALRELHSQLLELMNKRQIIIGSVENFSDRLAAMENERAALAAQLTPVVGTVSSPVAGFFVDTVDGFETYFPTDEAEISALTVEDIKKALATTPDVSEECIGKVSSDFTWYLVCTAPSERVAHLESGRKLDVKLPFVTGEAIATTVVAIHASTTGETAVILKCSTVSEELADIRIQTAQLLLKEYDGLKLPDSALQFDAENRAGAYVRLGTSIVFRYVDVLYHSDKDGYSICELTNESGYVQLYDDVVVKGKNLYDGKVVQS